MVMEQGTEAASIVRLLFTTQKRCGYYPNPKRPTWRCKTAPVWLVQLGSGRGAAVCDEHLSALTSEVR